MKDIFFDIKNDESGLKKEIKEYILNNPEEALLQVDKKINLAETTLDNNHIVELYKFSVKVFDIRTVAESVLDKLLLFYIKRANYLINEDNYSLCLLLDLFVHNPVIFNKNITIETFVNASYPMLFNIGADKYSNLDLAIDMFLSMLAFDKRFKKGHNILSKFIFENPDNPYVGDARQKLSEGAHE